VDADEWLSSLVQIDRIDRTDHGAFSAADAKPLLDDDTAALALQKGTGWAG
jgi:hypothetical protein